MIQSGDYIIYGSNGVCKVEDVGTIEKEGIPKDRSYYTLIPVYTKGNRIYTPVENNKTIIRPVISREDALLLIDGIEKAEPIDIGEDRRGEELIKEILAKCNCFENLIILKTLYAKRIVKNTQGKKHTMRDDKYYNLVKDNLVNEISLSLEADKENVESLIIETLSKCQNG